MRDAQASVKWPEQGRDDVYREVSSGDDRWMGVVDSINQPSPCQNCFASIVLWKL
jgi:hypothetical protein